MGKFNGVLLASDFDDTVYDLTFHIPQRNLDALDYFIAEGGRFTVSTGRAHRTFAAYASLLPINAPAVLGNGSALYDFASETTLVQTFLSRCAREDLTALCAAIPELGFEAYHGDDIYVHNFNAVTAAHMKKVGTGCTRCPISEMPMPWTKVVFQQEHDVLLQAQRWIRARCPGRYEVIFSNQYLLELTDAGSHKGGMVLRLAKLLGVQSKDIYCVGDNQNDIPMLAVSAIPFAPANCAQEVKDWGAEVLCHTNDGVIGDIVERLDKLY